MMLLLFAPQFVLGTDKSWTGTLSSTWSNGLNWSGLSPAGSGDNALFDSSFTNQPNAGTTTVGGIWMKTGAGQNVTISATALTLNGNTINGTSNLGILVDNTSSWTLTVSAPLKVANDQAWTNSSGNVLTVSGTVDTNGKALTVNGSGDTTMSGVVSNSGSITKSGTGTLALTGANTYSGATAINAGTLKIDNNNTTTARLASTSSITVNSVGTLLLAQGGGTASTNRINDNATATINGGGTFKTGGLSEGTRPTDGSATNGAAGMGALTLQNTTSSSHATIDFGSTTAGSSLVFSSLSAASKGAFVDILNWGGTAWTDNGATTNDRLLFATDPGFTATDLANFAFSGYATGAVEIVYGNLWEICPVPEPSTYVAGILTLSALFWNQRRRLFAVLRRNRK